jgi:proteasome lid subunit RPN8/RPN11
LPPTIRIRPEIASQLLAQARVAGGVECCGLLGGRQGVITQVIPAANAAATPAASYEIAPAELFGLMRRIRAVGLELLGIYHSHPRGVNQPSARDVERAYYPDAVYFVVSPLLDEPCPVRAFSIREGRVTELEMEVVDYPAAAAPQML